MLYILRCFLLINYFVLLIITYFNLVHLTIIYFLVFTGLLFKTLHNSN